MKKIDVKKVYYITFFFVAINLVVGYLFQISNGITCFTELSFIGLGSIIYWLLLFKPLKKITLNFIQKKGFEKISLLSLLGIGVVSVVLNLFFCQLFLIGSFAILFDCESPSFNTLTASLTNNLVGNLLCYSALVGLVAHDYFRKNQSTVSGLPPVSSNKKEKEKSSEKEFVLLSFQNSISKVYFREITHIEVQNNCITIFTEQKKKYVRYQSLNSFLTEVLPTNFKRIHRSAAVNLDFITKIQPNQNGDGLLILKNGINLKFSRSFKKELLKVANS